jgi:hypothetical protein
MIDGVFYVTHSTSSTERKERMNSSHIDCLEGEMAAYEDSMAME